jgi:3-methyladenine DNA glycosylase Tag
MQGPERVSPKNLADYLDVLTRAVFQSGISWRVVEAKWPGTREALYDFDPTRLAELTPEDINRLAEDTRLVRNRRKIEATVENAQTMLDLDREHHGFGRYLKSFSDFDSVAAELVKQFKFLGATGAYYFLHVVGEPVPPHEEWMAAHQARQPVSRAGGAPPRRSSQPARS